jgi:hypothetical protein
MGNFLCADAIFSISTMGLPEIDGAPFEDNNSWHEPTLWNARFIFLLAAGAARSLFCVA